MSKKIFIGAAITLALAALLYELVPTQTVAGIDIGATQYQHQTLMGNYEYRSLVKSAMGGNAASLADLVKRKCSEGTECDEHGAVMASILLNVGDGDFVNMAKKLDAPSRSTLNTLLSAGFERGKLRGQPPKFGWLRLYPEYSELMQAGK